ncbi:hypothetical protein C1752_00626 [Acaryochloris thomasi RCC1774]|uniref:Uncharacterized protein n=1 Tax=Acaryochloris thomasi RCC1774 TaxID=1764569 RepID=A0A2W1JNN5_9CYAN|nr:hypothetical protein [Acaryochloris thomasi]PZD74943.1 hypothetical protein C1752_00626 [Acaryochloris thomasi RCC1774]
MKKILFSISLIALPTLLVSTVNAATSCSGAMCENYPDGYSGARLRDYRVDNTCGVYCENYPEGVQARLRDYRR